MKNRLCLAALLLMLLPACAPFGTSLPTSTPLPASTPIPTWTPIPTSTLTPEPATGSISGKVIDSADSSLISSANISTNPPTSAVTTDERGDYSISEVPPGIYTVTAVKAGYVSTSVQIAVMAGKTTTADLHLAAIAEIPPTLAVTPSLNDGLVAYYPFDGDANDESSNGNHGEVHGAVLTTDRFGAPRAAYLFDGADDYIGCKHFPLLNVNHHTITAWIRIDASSGLRRIVGKVDPHVHETIDISIDADNHLRTNFATGSEKGHELLGATVLENDRWYLVAVAYDGTKVTLYVDGKADGIFPRSGTVRTSDIDLAIGRHGGYPYPEGKYDHYFSGSIDEVRIYNRALSEFEIQALSQR